MRTLLFTLLLSLSAFGQSAVGLWDATVDVNGLSIPFRFETKQTNGKIEGSFFNGDERVSSTNGSYQNGKLHLEFAHYATVLDATVTADGFEGTYVRAARGVNKIQAKRAHKKKAASVANVPNIAGVWEIQVKSPKGESAWRLITQQKGAEVSAAILRIDGDTGTLTGRYDGQSFVLSHYSGARPNLLKITPNQDGSIALVQNGKNEYTALRTEVARERSLPLPSDPANFTTVKDAKEPFAFSYPDLAGAIISNTDSRFRGKVVVVNITGSWCPNCHDEAPFLAELYRKYKGLGLEVVGLSFEEEEQLKDPSRLRAFIKEYGIEYPVLLAGQPSEVREKISQAVNLNAWPTTFFLGRDGTVKAVHVGFASQASGKFHQDSKHEIQATVERLLTEGIRSAR